MKKILCIFFCLLPILGGKAQTLYKDTSAYRERIYHNAVKDNNVLTINTGHCLERKPETGIQQCSHIDSIS